MKYITNQLQSLENRRTNFHRRCLALWVPGCRMPAACCLLPSACCLLPGFLAMAKGEKGQHYYHHQAYKVSAAGCRVRATNWGRWRRTTQLQIGKWNKPGFTCTQLLLLLDSHTIYVSVRVCACLCVCVCACAAFPLGYFPGTTFHGTDKAAMAAAAASESAAVVAVDFAVAAGSDNWGKSFSIASARQESTITREIVPLRERESTRFFVGNFAQTSVAASALWHVSSNKNCPRAVGNKIFDASCAAIWVYVCVWVCERCRVHSRQCQVDTFTNTHTLSLRSIAN